MNKKYWICSKSQLSQAQQTQPVSVIYTLVLNMGLGYHLKFVASKAFSSIFISVKIQEKKAQKTVKVFERFNHFRSQCAAAHAPNRRKHDM